MSRYKADVKVVGNSIGGRQGWAYVFNSGKVVVLEADLDKPQEYEDFKKYSKVRVSYTWKSRGIEMLKDGTLEWAKDEDYIIGSGGCCISNSYGYSDFKEDLEYSLAPTITQDSIVAIAGHSDANHVGWIRLYNVGRIDSQCMTVCNLIPLTEDEMQVIAQDVQRWVDR